MAPDRERRMFTNLDPRECNRLKALFLLRILEVVEDFAALSTRRYRTSGVLQIAAGA